MIVRSPCDVSTIFRPVYIGHARIQEFSSGVGGGGSRSIWQKKALTTVFFSPQLILLKSNGLFRRNYHFSRFQRGSNIFQGEGGPSFSRGGGSNCLFPIETHITCDFLGGGGVRTPCPPSGSALVGLHLSFVSFQYLSSDDVYNTTTQGDSIANGVKTEPEEGAGAHSSAGCFWTATGQTWTQGADSLDEAVAT